MRRIMEKFSGVIVALITPFTKDGINFESLGEHVDFLIESGVHGLFPLGSTGEFYAMSEEEKKGVISAVVDQTNGRVPVIAGVGHTNIKAASELAYFSKDAGADAILAVSPYYAPQSENSLIEYYSELAKVDLPLFAYNIPQFTGYRIPAGVIKELAENGLLAGIKDSSGDFMYFTEINEIGNISILQGQDHLLLPSLAIGADGGITASPNIFPEYAIGLFNSFKKGEIEKARAYHSKLVRLMKVLSFGVFPSGLKYAGRLMGRDFGFPRRPTHLSDRDRAEIKSILTDLGLL